MTMQLRIAFREEGNFWNAYLALPNTMNNAKLIGSIAMGAVKKNHEVKDGFMALMKQVLADAMESMAGFASPIDWEVTPAPESERSGHS